MAFKPFVEGGFVDVKPSSKSDHRGGKSIAFRMENPPSDLAFRYERSLFRKLLYRKKVRVVDHTLSSFLLGRENKKLEVKNASSQ